MVLSRKSWVTLHRWAGLFMLAFLFIVGLTGALLAFNHELDQLFLGSWASVTPTGPMLSPEGLLATVQAALPEAVLSLNDTGFADHPLSSVQLSAVPVGDAALPYDEVFVNPYTGAVLGTRLWGEIGLAAENIMPMIYLMHYSLLIGVWGGWGFWFLGIVVLVWIVDHIAVLFISFPKRGPMWKAFAIKWTGSAYRINVDWHRAVGLIFWPVLLVLAVTGASWNATFGEVNVVDAAISAIGPGTPYPMDGLTPLAEPLPHSTLSMDQVRAIVATRLGGVTPSEYWLGYDPATGAWDAWARMNDTGTAWYSAAISGADGTILAERHPDDRTVPDVIRDWIFPLHSGQAFGLAGRILVCLSGVLLATLCATGLVIWLKKAAARRHRAVKVTVAMPAE
jgi:uncharacterized iron-regulated membrane protein